MTPALEFAFLVIASLRKTGSIYVQPSLASKIARLRVCRRSFNICRNELCEFAINGSSIEALLNAA